MLREFGTENEEKLKVALDVSRTGTFRWEIDRNVVEWDDRLRELYGLRDGESINTIEEFLQRVHQDDRARVQAIVANAVAEESGVEVVMRIIRSDGTVRWLADKSCVFHRPDGTRYLIGACTDITGYKLVEDELMRARDAAEEVSRLKSQFLANMSHEMRTPLTIVVGFAEMLLDPGLDEATRRSYVETVLRHGRNLTALVSDLFDFAKIEAGSMTVQTRPVALAPLLATWREAHVEAARRKGIVFGLDSLGALPALIRTDAEKLRHIVDNVVDNAIKFTERGSVQVSVRLVTSPLHAQRRELELLITDTGVGIPHERQERLFDAFSQVDGTSTRRQGGTGLGLALARRLARLLGGDVTLLISSPGYGSTFRVAVPIDSGAPLPLQTTAR